MIERFRRNPPPLDIHNDGEDNTGSGRLQNMRSEGERLLDLGQDAISKALSSMNSEQFLRISRQEGGQ